MSSKGKHWSTRDEKRIFCKECGKTLEFSMSRVCETCAKIERDAWLKAHAKADEFITHISGKFKVIDKNGEQSMTWQEYQNYLKEKKK
jgi:hypothetical protein